MNEIPQDSIHQAAAEGDTALILEYLGKDPTLVSQLHSTQGTIPLVSAIRSNKVAAVECLLDADSPLDFVDKANNKLLMHFTTNETGDDRRRIRKLLVQKIFSCFKSLYYKLDLPIHSKATTLIILLLNRIIYYYQAHHFSEKNNLLEELTTQLKVFRIHSQTLDLKEVADLHTFVSNICAQIQASKEAIEYSQTAIHFYIKPLEQAASDEERLLYLIILTKLYQQMTSLLQLDNSPFAVLPIIKNDLDVHRELHHLLKLFQPSSTNVANALSTLFLAISQFNRHVNKLNELHHQNYVNTLPKVKPPVTGPTGKQPEQKPTPPNLICQIKRRVDAYNAKSSTTVPSFLGNSAKVTGPVAKQSEPKRVKFDLTRRSPGK